MKHNDTSLVRMRTSSMSDAGGGAFAGLSRPDLDHGVGAARQDDHTRREEPTAVHIAQVTSQTSLQEKWPHREKR